MGFLQPQRSHDITPAPSQASGFDTVQPSEAVRSFFTDQTKLTRTPKPAELVFLGNNNAAEGHHWPHPVAAAQQCGHTEIRIAGINTAKAPVESTKPTTTGKCPGFVELLTEFVMSHNPDVLGVSELNNSYVKYFKQALEGLGQIKMSGVYAYNAHAQVALFWDTATYVLHADVKRYVVVKLHFPGHA